MHCSRPTAFLILGSVAALSGCGISGPAHDEPMANAAAVVDMGFASFDPAVVHIRAGQTVQWRNTALITHNVSDDTAKAMNPTDASIPEGAKAFDSGDIPAGEVYSQTFTVPGSYKYFCKHHEDDGMLATVIVDPAP